MTVNLAINYGGRDEIVRGIKKIINSGKNEEDIEKVKDESEEDDSYEDESYEDDFDDDFVICCGDISGDRFKTGKWIKNNIKQGICIAGNNLGYNWISAIQQFGDMAYLWW